MTNRVAYVYHSDLPNHYYDVSHPMKPSRIRMAHNLVLSYGLFNHMDCYQIQPATLKELTQFHSYDYIHFLRKVGQQQSKHGRDISKYTTSDCPMFANVYDFCCLSSGGSLDAANLLKSQNYDTVVHWGGGLHHAKANQANGFCYTNDIVLGICELLKMHERVLYLDIDIHHGDGVEEAFYATNRVCTVSFHRYGEFFPGTGHYRDTGTGEGKGYAVNVPLKEGIDDDSYQYIFQPVIDQVMQWFKPTAIFMQCGADSLAGDRLGRFNISMKGHGACVQYMKSFNLPMILTGGGGYTVRNVSKTWCYETSIACGVDLDPKLPPTDYSEYYGPEHLLQVLAVPDLQNLNSVTDLDDIKSKVLQRLKDLEHVPSIQIESSLSSDYDQDNDDGDNDMMESDEPENKIT